MKALVCLLLSFNLVACATTERYVSLPEDGTPPTSSQVEPGNRVHVVTRDGRELEFTVKEAGEEGLVGDQETVPWRNIQTLQVLERDEPRALWIALAVVASIGAAVLISAAVESAATAAILNCSGC